MKKILFVLLLFTCIITITGCGKKEASLVGKWGQGSYLYTFKEDGTCTYDVSGDKMKCTYETDGDKLSIFFEGTDIPFTTTYKITGGLLVIKDSLGNDVEYIRR